MTDELFTVDPTPATPLQKARARLAKAEADCESIEAAIERLHDARRELNTAQNLVIVESNREMERLRAARKP